MELAIKGCNRTHIRYNDEVLSGPCCEEADRLEAEIAEVCGVVNAAQARLVDLVASVIETGAWDVCGIRSVEHWLCWKCGVSAGRARSLVAVASRVKELPATRAAFGSGELSIDQVGVIARHVPAHVESQACDLALLATVEQLQRVLPRYSLVHPLPKADSQEPASEVAPEPSPPEPDFARRVSFGSADDGSWQLVAHLGPAEGALVERALSAARDELYAAKDHRQGSAATPGDVSWADAFVAMADRSLSDTARLRPARDRHLMVIHLRSDGDAYKSSLHLGPALPDALRRQLGCDGRIRPVFEAGGVALSVGRTQRIVPERTRMAVEDRDGGCRVPGCTQRRWLEVHHLVHWEDGGATNTENLLALCSHHHHLHHKGRLGIQGDADKPDGVTFSDERGRPIEARGRPVPVKSLQVGVAGLGLRPTKWIHPSGEHLNPKYVQFHEAAALVV